MRPHLRAACAGLLLLAVPAIAGVVGRPAEREEDGIKIEIVGRVESLGAGDSFTMTARRATFRVEAGRGAGVLERAAVRPRVGQRVRVTGELIPPDRIEPERVEILAGGLNRPSSVISGTIRNLSLANERMSLVTPEGTVPVEWDQDTEFYRNRAESDARAFRNGEMVRVVGRRRGEGLVLARRVILGGEAVGWENNAAGEIVALDRRTQEAEIDFDGRVETVDLENASLRRRGQRIDFEDLKLGQDVRVQGTRRPRGPIVATSLDVVRQMDDERPAGGLVTLEGRVLGIVDANRSFRIRRADNSQELRVVVTEDTNIVRGATPVSFSAIRVNGRVRVRGTLRTGEGGVDKIDAARVEVLDPPALR
jgi:hypothetical protein